MTKLWLVLARLTGRLHLWLPTLWILGLAAGSLSRLGGGYQERLSYAFLMCHNHPRARRILAGLIRRELDSSSKNNLWLANMAWLLGASRLSLLLYRRTDRDYPGQSDAKVASSVGDFLEGVISQRISRELAAVLGQTPLPQKGSRGVVLTIVSQRFFAVFEVWLRQIQKLTPYYPLVLALDKATVASLSERCECGVLDVSAYFRFDEHGRLDRASGNNLWILRVLVLREILMLGYDVVSLDVDAIVVGDLDGMLRSFPEADIVAQMDYSVPVDVARRFGFILCCGVMAFHSNQRTIRFLDQYCARTALEQDDQLAINHLLAVAGLTNRVKTDRFTSFQSMNLTWLCPDPSLVSRDIDHGSVVRHFPLTERNADAVAKALGLQHP